MDDLASLGLVVKGDLSLRSEGDLSIDSRIKRVVAPDADIGPREDLRSALADDDHASPCSLAIMEFRSKILWIGVAKIL